LPTMVRIPPAQFAGGVIVAFYVLSITFLAPRFGVGNAILFAVTAQLLSSAVIDHYALAGASQRPLTSIRVLGLTIVIIGLVLTQIADRVSASFR
jgi:bacterial/archaeal transporter family-2 protein